MLILLVSLGGFASNISFADSFLERRVQVGMKLFRTLVNADLEISRKKNGNGEIPITLLYVDEQTKAVEYREQLKETLPSVSGSPVVLKHQSLEEVLKVKSLPAAIFITQTLTGKERQDLVDFSLSHGVIVFSPFEGDVEGGVLAGLSVQATVQPLLNMNSLSKGGFSIKSFYVQVAKHYE